MEAGHGKGFNLLGALVKERNIVLRGADALSQNGFTQVPNSMLKSNKLSAGAKLTYAMLLSYPYSRNNFKSNRTAALNE